MEMSQWSSLYSYLKKNKMSLFPQKRWTARQNISCLWIGISGRRENIRKGCKRVNLVEILCTHVQKWKNETCWNYSRNGGGEIKENDGGVNSTMIYCKNFCKCHNVPQCSNKKDKKYRELLTNQWQDWF
jgi:hypothetical protein